MRLRHFVRGVSGYNVTSDSAFAVFGLPRKFELDQSALETRYYELSKRLHPDRHTAGDAQARMKSQELSALLNQAYLGLRAPEARLETLLKEAGHLKETAQTAAKNQIPTELAEEYFEIQEAVMEGDERAPTLITHFRAILEQKKKALDGEMYEKARSVDWESPDSALMKSNIEKILELRREQSYVRSMLDNLEKLGATHG